MPGSSSSSSSSLLAGDTNLKVQARHKSDPSVSPSLAEFSRWSKASGRKFIPASPETRRISSYRFRCTASKDPDKREEGETRSFHGLPTNCEWNDVLVCKQHGCKGGNVELAGPPVNFGDWIAPVLCSMLKTIHPPNRPCAYWPHCAFLRKKLTLWI